MKRFAFTMIEILVVVLLLGIIIAVLMRLLSSTFTSAQKGMDTLTLAQENSKLIASLKQDMRTIILGGPDNIPAPEINPLVSEISNNTDSFTFYRVWNIHESGRPLVVKITYQKDMEQPGKPFGVTVSTGSGEGAEPLKKFVTRMLTHFHIQLLNSKGEVINTDAARKGVKKIRLVLESKGTERLATTVSIYSPYIIPEGSVSPHELWIKNFQCYDFQPGAATRLCEGGIIQGTSLVSIGTPMVLRGETPIVTPP